MSSLFYQCQPPVTALLRQRIVPDKPKRRIIREHPRAARQREEVPA
jgi:hypothetical protein